MSFTFAVLGDLHSLDPGRAHAGSTEEHAYSARVRREIWPGVLEEVRRAAPDFVLQTGDLLHGGALSEGDARAEALQVLDELRSLGVPIWFALGNHDAYDTPSRRVWSETIGRHLAAQLGRPLEAPYYSFSVEGARFLVLDYRETGAEQFAWLEREAARRPPGDSGERLFLSAHAPLYAVARPFFDDPRFTTGVRLALRGRPVDAHFCGHTHNACASLHPWGHGRLLQLKSAIVAEPGREPLPLLHVRTPLQAGSPQVLWGYLEDTAPGWLRVVDEGERVIVEHHVVGRGVIAQASWREPGLLERVEAGSPTPAGLSPEEARRIRSGRIYLALWNSVDPEKTVRLNDTPVGNAPVSDWFLPRSYVEIPDAAIGAIRRINDVVIENARGEEFCAGGAYLEVRLDDGRVVRSTASDFLVATGDRWDAWNEPTLLKAPPGRPVELRALRFR
jgi:hypothetical protein